MTSRTDRLVALGLLVLAAAVRLPAFAPPSLWRDDAWQVLAGRASSLTDLSTYGLTSPGFAAMLALVLRLPGRVEPLGQVVPLVFGCLAPPVLHLAARRLGASVWGAAAAGSLLAVSSAAAVYSTRIKPYTFDALLELGVLLLAGLVLQHPSLRRWCVLLVAVSVAALASAQGLIAGGVAVALCLLRPASRRCLGRHWPLLVLPVTAAAVAWVWYVRQSTGNVLLGAWWREQGAYPTPTWAGLWDAWRRLLVGLLPGGRPEHPWHADPDTAELVTALALGVLLAAVGVAVLRGRGWLVAVALAPALVALAGSFAGRIPFGTRVDIPFYPGLLLALALATRPGRSWRSGPRRRALARGLAAGACLVVVLPLAWGAARQVAPSYPDDHFRQLVEALQRQRLPDDRVLVDTYGTYPIAAYRLVPFRVERTLETYTGFRVVPHDPDRLLLSTEPGDVGLQLTRLARVVEERQPLWVVETGMPQVAAGDPQYLSHGGPDNTVYTRALRLSGSYELCRQQDWPGARLTLWKPRGTC